MVVYSHHLQSRPLPLATLEGPQWPYQVLHLDNGRVLSTDKSRQPHHSNSKRHVFRMFTIRELRNLRMEDGGWRSYRNINFVPKAKLSNTTPPCYKPCSPLTFNSMLSFCLNPKLVLYPASCMKFSDIMFRFQITLNWSSFHQISQFGTCFWHFSLNSTSTPGTYTEPVCKQGELDDPSGEISYDTVMKFLLPV